MENEILKYADPITDNILAGFNEDNYQKYARDFDEVMKNALPIEVFHQTRELMISKIGLYKSYSLKNIQKKDQFIIVLYVGEFEKETQVEIKVVLQKYPIGFLVSGLWFNSPKLRN